MGKNINRDAIHEALYTNGTIMLVGVLPGSNCGEAWLLGAFQINYAEIDAKASIITTKHTGKNCYLQFNCHISKYRNYSAKAESV